MGEDILSRKVAMAHAKTIKQYWQGRGFDNVTVDVRLVADAGESVKYDHHVIRSNLDGRGLPPGAELRAFKYQSRNGKRRVEIVPR